MIGNKINASYLIVPAHILALNKHVLFTSSVQMGTESGEAEMQSFAEAAVDSVFKGEETDCQENCPFALHPFCEEAAAMAIIITRRTYTKAAEQATIHSLTGFSPFHLSVNTSLHYLVQLPNDLSITVKPGVH